MIPHVQTALQTLSQKILANVLPTINSSYVMSDTAMLATLVNALANEAESGIANRLADIQAMEAIFQTAKATGFNVAEEYCRAKSFLAKEMTLTSINQRHDTLTNQLIDLHGRVEDEATAGELNAAIWEYLAEHNQRHELSI